MLFNCGSLGCCEPVVVVVVVVVVVTGDGWMDGRVKGGSVDTAGLVFCSSNSRNYFSMQI